MIDMGTKNSPSYSVEIVGQESREPIVITLYPVKLSPDQREWWISRAKPDLETTSVEATSVEIVSA